MKTLRDGPALLYTVIFYIAAALAGHASPPADQHVSDLPDRIILSLTEDPATSMAVAWRSRTCDSPPSGQITVATGFTNLEKNARTVEGTTEEASLGKGGKAYHHTIVFDSLEPDTLYAYRVGCEENWSEWNQFRTAGKSPAPFRFINFGDPQDDIRSRCSRLFRTAYRTAPDASLWHFTGDLVNNGGSDPEWDALFHALGWAPRTTPFMLLPGNHGYVSKKIGDRKIWSLSPLWKPHFRLPENGPPGLEETAYFVDYQGVRFVMLNGNEKLAEQAEWLDRTLARDPQRWTIAAIHQPMYSTAKERDNPHLRKLFIPVFDRHGVDLVLQGHDHTYGRTCKLRNGIRVADDEKGTVYVVSVSGPKVYDLNEQNRNIMVKYGTGRQLFQVIGVESDRLSYEAFDAVGKSYDAFELRK